MLSLLKKKKKLWVRSFYLFIKLISITFWVTWDFIGMTSIQTVACCYCHLSVGFFNKPKNTKATSNYNAADKAAHADSIDILLTLEQIWWRISLTDGFSQVSAWDNGLFLSSGLSIQLQWIERIMVNNGICLPTIEPYLILLSWKWISIFLSSYRLCKNCFPHKGDFPWQDYQILSGCCFKVNSYLHLFYPLYFYGFPLVPHYCLFLIKGNDFNAFIMWVPPQANVRQSHWFLTAEIRKVTEWVNQSEKISHNTTQ